MSELVKKNDAQFEVKSQKWADFLATAPPDSSSEISDLWQEGQYHNSVLTPDVFLHCDSDECDGPRFFAHQSSTIYVKGKDWQFGFLHYACRNCEKRRKTYSVAIRAKSAQAPAGFATKIGEVPPFGPHTPARVISLIGPDKEIFLQGRRSENRGMGIGAFAYYRRVVENQKNRIIGEIGKVAARLGAKPETLQEFELAAKEVQFSKAIEQIKHGIPEVLLIDGHHNPLTLLHDALSEGLHADSDSECLEIAQAIRVVLTELAERISQALKKEAELTSAVSRLLNRKSAKLLKSAQDSSDAPKG